MTLQFTAVLLSGLAAWITIFQAGRAVQQYADTGRGRAAAIAHVLLSPIFLVLAIYMALP